MQMIEYKVYLNTNMAFQTCSILYLPYVSSGFEKTNAACCGDGGPYNYNKGVQCGDPATTVCPDPSLYINWDGPHFTEAANRLITSFLLKGPYTIPHLDVSCISEVVSSKNFTNV